MLFDGKIDLGPDLEAMQAFGHFGRLSPGTEYGMLHGVLHASLAGVEGVSAVELGHVATQAREFYQRFGGKLSDHERWILAQLAGGGRRTFATQDAEGHLHDEGTGRFMGKKRGSQSRGRPSRLSDDELWNDAGEAEEPPLPRPEDRPPQEKSVPPAAKSYLMDKLKPLLGKHNMATIKDLREALPYWTREEQDRVLTAMIYDGTLTVSRQEGRHGTAEEKKALEEGGLVIGGERVANVHVKERG